MLAARDSKIINALIVVLALARPMVAIAADIQSDNTQPVAGFKDQAAKDKKTKKLPEPDSVGSKLYRFFVRTVANTKIHEGLNKLYQEQSIDTKNTYGLSTPHLKLKASAEKSEVDSVMKDELKSATAKETLAALPYVKDFTKKFDFSFNLLSPFANNSSAAPKTYVTAEDFAKRSGIVPIVATSGNLSEQLGGYSDMEVMQKEPESKWANLGRFNGAFGSADADKIATDGGTPQGFTFTLRQHNDLYQMVIPLAKDKSEERLHRLRLPVYEALALGRDMDFKGKVMTTRIHNLLIDERAPRFDLFYAHGDSRYGSEYVYHRGQQSLEVQSSLPANSSSDAAAGAQYDLKYNLNF